MINEKTAIGPMSSARDERNRYRTYMVHSESANWLSEAARPLISKFGDRLSLFRDGDRVQWSYDGQAAIFELRADGIVEATFVDRPAIDAVTSTTACAVYRGRGVRYFLTADGCTRVVSDMVDFFSGTREPEFAFVDAITVDPLTA